MPTINTWNQAATVRNQQIEDGTDITFLMVFIPIYLRIFNEISPKDCIEIGAGTGHLAKALSEHCASIVAIEPSPGMFEIAKKNLSQIKNVNIFNQGSNEFNKNKKFDLAYSHMCCHTVEKIDDFFRSIASTLKNNGLFVTTLPHPCFYNNYKNYLPENFDYMSTIETAVELFISQDKNTKIPNIPYFHRPISEYINTLSRNNLLIEEFIEIIPDRTIREKYFPPWDRPRYCTIITRKIS